MTGTGVPAARSHAIVQNAIRCLALATGGRLLLAVRAFLPAACAAGPAAVVTRGPTDRPQIALTFDDNFFAERSLPALRALVANAHNGAIMLMHMSATHTFEAIPGIIHDLRARGYELLTVSELLNNGRRFLDVRDTTPGASAIGRMVDSGFMSGYDENYFGPVDQVTRAQFAKVAVLVAGLHTPEVETANGPTFSDVPMLLDANGNPLTYPFDYVEEATATGLVAGRPAGDGFAFSPREPIARVQLGLMTGYTDGSFRAWGPALRAHVAQVMIRFLDPARYQPSPRTTTLPPTTTTIPEVTTTIPTAG